MVYKQLANLCIWTLVNKHFYAFEVVEKWCCLWSRRKPDLSWACFSASWIGVAIEASLWASARPYILRPDSLMLPAIKSKPYYTGVSIKKGPQNRPQYMILFIRAPKKGLLIFRNSHMESTMLTRGPWALETPVVTPWIFLPKFLCFRYVRSTQDFYHQHQNSYVFGMWDQAGFLPSTPKFLCFRYVRSSRISTINTKIPMFSVCEIKQDFYHQHQNSYVFGMWDQAGFLSSTPKFLCFRYVRSSRISIINTKIPMFSVCEIKQDFYHQHQNSYVFGMWDQAGFLPSTPKFLCFRYVRSSRISTINTKIPMFSVCEIKQDFYHQHQNSYAFGMWDHAGFLSSTVCCRWFSRRGPSQHGILN